MKKVKWTLSSISNVYLGIFLIFAAIAVSWLFFYMMLFMMAIPGNPTPEGVETRSNLIEILSAIWFIFPILFIISAILNFTSVGIENKLCDNNGFVATRFRTKLIRNIVLDYIVAALLFAAAVVLPIIFKMMIFSVIVEVLAILAVLAAFTAATCKIPMIKFPIIKSPDPQQSGAGFVQAAYPQYSGAGYVQTAYPQYSGVGYVQNNIPKQREVDYPERRFFYKFSDFSNVFFIVIFALYMLMCVISIVAGVYANWLYGNNVMKGLIIGCSLFIAFLIFALICNIRIIGSEKKAKMNKGFLKTSDKVWEVITLFANILSPIIAVLLLIALANNVSEEIYYEFAAIGITVIGLLSISDIIMLINLICKCVIVTLPVRPPYNAMPDNYPVYPWNVR